jgi:hypothetical protein
MDSRLSVIEEKLSKIEERLHSLVEINNRLVHENIRKSITSSQPIVTPQVVEGRGVRSESPQIVHSAHIWPLAIQIENVTDTTFKVTGKTYPHRNIMRDANGEWDKASMCWTFHVDHKEVLISLLKENNVEFTHL